MPQAALKGGAYPAKAVRLGPEQTKTIRGDVLWMRVAETPDLLPRLQWSPEAPVLGAGERL